MSISNLNGRFGNAYIMPYHTRLDPLIYDSVQYAFILAMDHLSAPPHVAGGAWQYVLMRYSEPHRKYHTIGHIAGMLQAADQLGWFAPEAEEKGIKFRHVDLLAIFFHDIVYTVGAPPSVNERESAEELERMTPALRPAGYFIDTDGHPTTCYQEDAIRSASNLILATAEFLSDDVMPSAWPICDLDLSTFAMEYEHFDGANHAVREELGITRQQHAKFFERMLNRKQIFYLATEWEERARFNLRRYIQLARQEAVR